MYDGLVYEFYVRAKWIEEGNDKTRRLVASLIPKVPSAAPWITYLFQGNVDWVYSCKIVDNSEAPNNWGEFDKLPGVELSGSEVHADVPKGEFRQWLLAMHRKMICERQKPDEEAAAMIEKLKEAEA
jgi:hypothetical protein